jgi:hypothetical protein
MDVYYLPHRRPSHQQIKKTQTNSTSSTAFIKETAKKSWAFLEPYSPGFRKTQLTESGQAKLESIARAPVRTKSGYMRDA